MEHQPDLGWITDPYGHYREISTPPGAASLNYALSRMAHGHSIPALRAPAGSPANLTAHAKRLAASATHG